MAKNIWEEYDFNSIEEFFDYVHESKVNGQLQQVRDLWKEMSRDQQRAFMTYAREMGYDDTINWINEKMAEGGEAGKYKFINSVDDLIHKNYDYTSYETQKYLDDKDYLEHYNKKTSEKTAKILADYLDGLSIKSKRANDDEMAKGGKAGYKEDMNEAKKLTEKFLDEFGDKFNLTSHRDKIIKSIKPQEYLGHGAGVFIGFSVSSNIGDKLEVGETKPSNGNISISSDINPNGIGDGKTPDIARDYTIDLEIKGRKRFRQRTYEEGKYAKSYNYARDINTVIEKFDDYYNETFAPKVKQDDLKFEFISALKSGGSMATGGEVDYKKKIYLGKVDYYGRGRKINAVDISIEIKNKPKATDWETLKEVQNVPELSMSGAIWDGRHYDNISGGQNLDEIEKLFPENKKLKRLVEIWREYHLNDLKAGTKKQTQALDKWRKENNVKDWGYDKAVKHLKSINLIEDNGYKYGSKWLYEPLPPSIIEEVKKLATEVEIDKKAEGGEAEKKSDFASYYANHGAIITGGSYFNTMDYGGRMAKGGAMDMLSRRGDFHGDVDPIFEGLADMSQKGKKDKALDKMLAISYKEASKKNLLDFAENAKNISDKRLKEEILDVVKNIMDGKYRAEFRFIYGGKAGDVRKVSTTSSFFSQFEQGYTYGKLNKGGKTEEKNKIGIDFQSDFSSGDRDVIEDEVQSRVANRVRHGYTSGELTEEYPDYTGWWEISIEEDENDEETRNVEVARSISSGNTSGYEPTFSWSANVWKN